MEVKHKKFWGITKYITLSAVFLILMGFCLFNFGFLSNFTNVKFDKNKLNYENTEISVFNNNNNLIRSNIKQKNINAEEIPKNIIDAFISIEDKNFYKHNGINYKRMVASTLKNIKSKSLKEGASTISQQVIKNTHLTNEKTLKRKLNEILLTQKLEKNLSKDEIITSYLNAIYFGGGAFGINNASQRYFSKDAKELTIAEGATLAGIIKSPSKYSPITHPEECVKRRNVVLREMLKDNKISKEEYDKAKDSKLNLNLNRNCLGNNSYYSASINEACKILKLSEKDLMLKEYKIYTYQNDMLQKIADEEINNSHEYCKQDDSNCLILSMDNKTGGINAFSGKSDYDLLSLSRQPGSVFKPIISYAPALEYNIINPLTPILDEKINIDGYEPKNYNNVYHGWTSSKDCLAKSLNIPSVKLLNYVGIDKAKNIANKLNINFEATDNGYALALGGMTKGVKIKDLTNCYQCFANNGRYIESGFVKEIKTKDGKTIYKHDEVGKQVIKDSTAYLLNDMLKESVKSGTCKKLNIASYKNICAKTGTVGVNNKQKENSDVWSLSYTPQNTLCVWFGSTDNKNLLPKNITGANTPTFMAQSFYSKAKLNKENFVKPDSVIEVDINALEYSNNQKIMLASSLTPDRYKIKVPFSLGNEPKETSNIFDEIEDILIGVTKSDENTVEIKFKANNYIDYEIMRKDDDNEVLLTTIKNKNENILFCDNTLKQGNLYTYYVLAKYNNNINNPLFKKSKKSNEVKILLTQNNPLF